MIQLALSTVNMEDPINGTYYHRCFELASPGVSQFLKETNYDRDLIPRFAYYAGARGNRGSRGILDILKSWLLGGN